MLVAEFQQYFFGFSIFITSLFLVMLVLVQRGRGGGLTGALGGAGGQSAFGTKAGDLFTRITVGVAALWIFLCAAAVFFLRDRALPQTGVDDRNLPALNAPQTPGLQPSVTPNLGSDPAAAPAAPAAVGVGGAAGGLSEPAPDMSLQPANSDLPAGATAAETPAPEANGVPAADTPAAETTDNAADGPGTPAATETALPPAGE